MTHTVKCATENHSIEVTAAMEAEEAAEAKSRIFQTVVKTKSAVAANDNEERLGVLFLRMFRVEQFLSIENTTTNYN